MCMRELIKSVLWVGCLALGLQSAWAFSLLGPLGVSGTTGGTEEDNWQVTLIGYNPLPGFGPPFFTDGQPSGPKNILEGYRLNTPVLYYAFDPDFSYFGSNGEYAVQQAFDILNSLTNVDSYSAGLTEFPLNSQSVNYQAQALGLYDVKSMTLSLMMEQMGLADAIRYTWALADRNIPSGATCNPPGPGNGVEYAVIQRNFDIIATPLNQIQYSAYVNAELYTYFISENCGAPGGSPPDADALEIPVDPLNPNPPVASGHGEGLLLPGAFYTGLTRDDMAGLRYLLSTNNPFAPSPAYRESPAGGSLLFSTNFNSPQLLYTSNFNALVSASLTNSPVALQALFPGLVVNPNAPSYFSNVVSPNVIAYFTNFVGQPADQPATLVTVTTYVTNIVQFFLNSFGNVVTNKSYTNTSYAIQTITVGPPIGWPAGTPFVTNVTYQVFQSNVVSGDYFIITNGACGPNIIQTLQTNVNVVTNAIVGVTNANGQMFVQNLISYFTNHTFVVQPCTLVTNAVADYQGIGQVQFVRVRDDNYDYQSGTFFTPITNQYTMVVITNGQLVTQTFQRVVTRPDIIFSGQDLSAGGGDTIFAFDFSSRTTPDFINSRGASGLAGPGTIDPTSSTNIEIVFNTVGPVYVNSSPTSLTGPSLASEVIWGSFDGTTNAPVVYPNGTSIANLAASALIQISPPPPTLPNGIKGVAYNVQLTATNATAPFTWTLASGSAGLPYGSPNLTLSSGGLVTGTPTNSATYDNIVIQMTDSSVPPRTVQMIYSLTIN